jgi:hypothetical protein
VLRSTRGAAERSMVAGSVLLTKAYPFYEAAKPPMTQPIARTMPYIQPMLSRQVAERDCLPSWQWHNSG